MGETSISMKRILYLLLGLIWGIAAHSQKPVFGTDSTLLQWKLQVLGSSPLSINGFQQLQTLAPDGMPCLVPDLVKVERMPVWRAGNADPMPNGFRRGKVWSIADRPARK